MEHLDCTNKMVGKTKKVKKVETQHTVTFNDSEFIMLYYALKRYSKIDWVDSDLKDLATQVRTRVFKGTVYDEDLRG